MTPPFDLTGGSTPDIFDLDIRIQPTGQADPLRPREMPSSGPGCTCPCTGGCTNPCVTTGCTGGNTCGGTATRTPCYC